MIANVVFLLAEMVESDMAARGNRNRGTSFFGVTRMGEVIELETRQQNQL
jgi:hypothetical protein